MRKISKPINELKSHYDVVVVGSGYGGGVAASRLARAGRNVCVLERGKEFLPGEFPDTLGDAQEQMQFRNGKGISKGDETGLFDFFVGDDISVLVGCGLGGTSLINASVVMEAEGRVFDSSSWPQEILNDLNGRVAHGYARARKMLSATPYPERESGFPELDKTKAMRQAANALNEEFKLPDLAVNFKPERVNDYGVEQSPCINCGDCFSGCNYTAKNTVQMNYLPDAFNFGAEIFTEASVRYVEQQNAKWIVHYRPVGAGREGFEAEDPFVIADIVVLAAGTLGTTEILHRSKSRGLIVSNQLGKKFTGNGDVLAFAYNNDQSIDGIGWGDRNPDKMRPVGPTITGLIDTRSKASNFKEGMSIEEGAIPGALSKVLPFSFSALAKFIGKDTDSGFKDYVAEVWRKFVSKVGGAYRGATRNTQTFLVMTHDSADGELKFENDHLNITWPGVGDEEIFKKVEKRLLEITEVLGGTYIPNPMWSKSSIYTDLFGSDLLTVHPLGGCATGEDASSGVTNHRGQVFAGASGTDVHRGLYVADGSFLPTTVGINPLLTIAGLAERNMAMLIDEEGWDYDDSSASSPPGSPPPVRPGIQFTETMGGGFSTKDAEDEASAAEIGESEGSRLKFILTIVSNDLETMLVDEAHEADMSGTVEASALSPEVLTVSEGKFNLFMHDPSRPETKRMRYRMRLTSQEGEQFYFEGYKVIHNDPGFDLWSDTTRLYVTVYKGTDSSGDKVGMGVLSLSPKDFAKQLTTMKVFNVDSKKEELEYTAKFGQLFAGALFDSYGGIFTGLNYFDPNAAPRKRRELKAPAPEIYGFASGDGIPLRLTRYEGGKKGPVILSHGLGVSSRIFSTDTIDTNLVEYLVAHEYDVWLLDYRSSIELPAAKIQANGDKIAEFDYPPAVEEVSKITGAESVQMVVHCFGATTWTMSMLGGYLNGVRSAVVSQVSTHAKPPFLTKLKTGLHIPTFLEKIGIDSLTAYVDSESNWVDKLIDKGLKLYPIEKEERCSSAVCHRITFLYGHLYEHDQLNDLSHKCLHEMFGLANIDAFEHLAQICRNEHVVNAEGEDVYLSHLDRMAIPITFISGEENACFLPESTEITYNKLREVNGDGLYQRHVIPNYGHIDCIFGKNAAVDVYPKILKQLEENA